MGIIALDIDGTVTGVSHAMPAEVEQFLAAQVKEGWEIVFITGRTFDYGFEVLKECTFSYYYASFNGAQLMRMPEREVVRRHEADGALVPLIVKACATEGTDPQLHGVERAVWRPHKLIEADRLYLEERLARSGEKWEGVKEFANEPFLYAKMFAPRAALERIAERLGAAPLVCSVIQDPLRPMQAVMLITAAGATKGAALRDVRKLVGGVAIAAGDDFNDVSMLEEADVSIAMRTGPQLVREMADIVAPPSTENGIIEGIEKAKWRL